MTNIEEKESKTNGRWTKVEHQKFLLGLQLYGKNWKKIQQLVATRNGSQIRSHAQKFFLKVKKTVDGHQGSQNGQESQQLHEPMTVISKTCSESEENQTSHSYFMSKIIKATTEDQYFNFWEEFIDISSSKCETQSVGQVRRKDSFVIFDTCLDSKQETALSCLPILGEPIL